MNNAQQTKRVTFKNIYVGHFESYLDGVKTVYGIVNGSLGLSGRDTYNMYGVTRMNADGTDTEKVTWLGPLATCKKMITFTLLKKAAQ